jgi:hypothetical protein
MKHIIFTTAVLLVLTFSIYSRSDDDSCPQIRINSPEIVNENDESFKVSASFEDEKVVTNSKFNWTIIKDNQIVKKFNEGVVEIETSDTRKQNRIIILAENLDVKCQNPATAKVIVIPNVGSPLIFDQYSKLNWNDERAHLDAIAIEMQKYEDSELFVWIKFDKKTFSSNAKTKLLNILNHLSMRGLKKNRITFMISEADRARLARQWRRPKPQSMPDPFL